MIDIITSDTAFAALAPCWNALADRMSARSVFLRHEWFAAAWAWRRLDSALHALVLRDGDRVVGILPLVYSQAVGPAGGLGLLTVPDTQCCDMICAPADAGRVAEAFARDLAGNARWTALDLDFLPPAGPCAQALLPALQDLGCRVAERRRDRNLFIALHGSWNEYFVTRSRSLKKKLNL
ncbi:MAG: hypothetical protein ABIP49_11110, partial [Lysobacterales bacterium]